LNEESAVGYPYDGDNHHYDPIFVPDGDTGGFYKRLLRGEFQRKTYIRSTSKKEAVARARNDGTWRSETRVLSVLSKPDKQKHQPMREVQRT
jgi:hypothetical protein